MKKWFYLGIFIVLFIGIYIFKEIKEHQVEQKVIHYLITTEGYDKEEIQKVSGGIEKFGVIASVVFKDEPDLKYNYGVKDDRVFVIGYGYNQNSKPPSNQFPKHWKGD